MNRQPRRPQRRREPAKNESSFDRLYREFTQKLSKDKILPEIKRRRFYIKPSTAKYQKRRKTEYRQALKSKKKSRKY